ncbi:unnamed protein product [Effrenium voratum]|nr:unnamed protein product [Effrenium voratum]
MMSLQRRTTPRPWRRAKTHLSTRATTTRSEMDHMMAVGLAIMFLGMIFVAGLVAMVIAYPDPQIRHYCVRICSSTVVIFIAIAIEHAALISTLIGHFTGLKHGWRASIIPFCGYWCITILVSFKVRHNHLNFHAARMVLSHVTAFVAMFGCSDVLFKFGYTKSTESMPKWQAVAYRCALWCCFAIFSRTLRKVTYQIVIRLPFTCEVPGHGHGQGHEAEGDSHEGHAEHTAAEAHGEHAHTAVDTPESVAHFIEEVDEALEEAALIVLSYLAVKFLVYKTVLEVFDLRSTFRAATRYQGGILECAERQRVACRADPGCCHWGAQLHHHHPGQPYHEPSRARNLQLLFDVRGVDFNASRPVPDHDPDFRECLHSHPDGICYDTRCRIVADCGGQAGRWKSYLGPLGGHIGHELWLHDWLLLGEGLCCSIPPADGQCLDEQRPGERKHEWPLQQRVPLQLRLMLRFGVRHVSWLALPDSAVWLAAHAPARSCISKVS